MNNEIVKQDNAEIIQKLVLHGDLSKMNETQKVSYYKSFCDQLGLNPLTQPFQLIVFQGKQRLYATKDCTEQLRKLHGVSITDISTTSLNDVFIVTAKAQDKNGKTDCSTGAVNIKGLQGDNLANALMKAETKAKRRVTLSICGLGILDESETETIKGAVKEDLSGLYTGDEMNQSDPQEIDDVPTREERQLLKNLVYTSDLTDAEKETAFEKIETCVNYKQYEAIQHRLEARQQSIHEIVNPTPSDVNKHLKATVQ